MTAHGPDLRPPAVFLMGQTAAGKTETAVELAQRLPLAIVSVDSAMVYRGMDIGTAKPAPDILHRTPHRLIDICDPAEPYSAARFRADALREIAAITARGAIPLLAGGTLLYFRALEQGLSELPAADPGLRARLTEQGREQGWPALHRRLAQLDPQAAARIHPNDPQRIQRALEVHALGGRAMSELLAAGRIGVFPYRVIKIKMVVPDRATLQQRVVERFRRMLEQGFLAEVEGLHRRGDLHPGLPSIRAVGYRQLWRYLDGQCRFEEAVERGIIATRQLAKRQMTWLRREPGGEWFDAGARNIFDKVLKLLADGAIYGKHGS